jgi:hypothetical protein
VGRHDYRCHRLRSSARWSGRITRARHWRLGDNHAVGSHDIDKHEHSIDVNVNINTNRHQAVRGYA